MATLIVPNTVRLTLTGKNLRNNRAVDNVIDMQITGGGTMSRPAAIADTVQRVAHHWQDDILPVSQNDYEFLGIHWIDLDSDTGPSGFLIADSGHQTVGSVTGTSAPPQVAVLVEKPL